MAADLLATAGLRVAAGAVALLILPAAFAAGLVGDAASALADALASGLATAFTGLGAGFAAAGSLAGPLTAGLAVAVTGLVTALAAVLTLSVTALDLGSFPDLAFTWSLLVELAEFCSVALWAPWGAFDGNSCGVSPARECTGFAVGKPISCKIETNIALPAIIESPIKPATSNPMLACLAQHH